MYNAKDHTQQLAEYILRNLSKGYTLDSLRAALMVQGYSKISVDNAIKKANKILAEKVPPMQEKPQITYRIIESQPIEESGHSADQIVYEETYNPEEKKGFWRKLKEKLF